MRLTHARSSETEQDIKIKLLRKNVRRRRALFTMPRTNITVGLDHMLGLIPKIGAIFDMIDNANIRNVAAPEINLHKTAVTAKEVRPAPALAEIA